MKTAGTGADKRSGALALQAERLEAEQLDAMLDAAFPTASASTRRMLAETVNALSQLDAERVREQNRENATRPRKPVTRAKLVAYLEQYEHDHGTTRGAKKAAALEFGVDGKTLKKRMTE